MKFKNGSLGYYQMASFRVGDGPNRTRFLADTRGDVVQLVNILSELGAEVTSLEEGLNNNQTGFKSQHRVGYHIISDLPWEVALEQQAAWHAECVPVVSGERARREEVDRLNQKRIAEETFR